MAKKGNPYMMVNSHLWWQSIDRFVGAENTFDYSNNIDIHSSLKTARLWRAYQSSALTDLDTFTSFASIPWYLFKFVLRGTGTRVYRFQDWATFSEWTLVATIPLSWMPYSCCVFDGKIFLFTDSKIREFNPSSYTYTNRTPGAWRGFTCKIIPSLNFYESWILVWQADKLLWYDPVLLTRSIVRDFTQWSIVGIIEYEEQVWIVVNHNWYDSRIYILWWNFDVDDIGVIKTLPLPWISVQTIWQMGNQVFLVAQDDDDINVTDFYELQWSIPVLIKSSRYTDWSNAVDFILMNNSSVATKKRDKLVWDGKYVYIPCRDGIYRYWSPNRYIPQAFCQFSSIFDGWNNYTFWQPRWYTIHGNYLYVCWINWSFIWRWYIWNEPSRINYIAKWFVKYRTYYSWAVIARNQNIRIIIWYKLTPGASINVYLWANYKNMALIDTITTVSVPSTWGQYNMRHVLEATNTWAEDRNVVDVKLELIVWSNLLESPEIFEFYLEHTPINYV